MTSAAALGELLLSRSLDDPELQAVKDTDGPGGRVPATTPDLPVDRLACELLPTAKNVREFRVVNGLTRGALTDALADKDAGTVVHA
ncbi:hypothetical protein LWC33_15745 [Pseudonocardia sp. RS11V-5]|uniref:hypothetical protein n=1 Tax=Pseudonocardia terrae TaxID=2905831 RepID=UPI001E5CE43E|nr:hypothetical protein [Pseudonocardia terrae]MCE3552903.1 hypothetical protein [Pseudonocardia terrae]